MPACPNLQLTKVRHTDGVEMAPVQQQVGGKDCGLFAVAFATELANGGDPVKVQYDQCAMREHYYSCLEGGEL